MEPSAYLFAGSDVLLWKGEPEISAFDLENIATLKFPRRRYFEWAGSAKVAIAIDDEGAAEAARRGLVRLPIRQALSNWTAEEMRPALKALALLNWLDGAQYCGACGTPLVDESPGAKGEDGETGARHCPSCGRVHFPRISPAVIVLVKKAGKALLARNARFPPGGRFGLLAGFVEAGETLEEAAHREVGEEAGIVIRNLRYVASQPWPFPDSLMLAFTAEWAGGEARPDGGEIAEVRWCGPDELPDIPPPGSVARRLIDEFLLA